MQIHSANSQYYPTELVQHIGELAQKNVVPAQEAPSLVTPEDVNTQADLISDKINTAKEAQTEALSKRNNAAMAIYEQQHQQTMTEIYAQVYSGQSIDSSDGVDLETAADFYQNRHQSQLANSLINRETQERNLAEHMRESLEERHSPSIQPVENLGGQIDIRV
ncbi:hypothetical protein [Agaribacterium sp. ZY112]|uniref:hypothetical protein n=1 Tax=Agaribacterium sp. ZY112 TaxID=3233574 RepID=UPI003523761A